MILAVPALTTSSLSSITQTTASGGGEITSDGGAAITARGVVWSTSANPTVALSTKTSDGTGKGIFTSNITGLAANTKYYVRAYATNRVGTSYGNEVSFTTIPQPTIPVLTTTAVSSITRIAAASGGNITSDGGAAVTARGVVWSTSINPTVALSTKTTDGSGTGNFSSNVTNLTANTTYYLRAYATNSIGTAYGNEINFTTASIPTSVTDIENNVYPVVVIGTQVWMKENLRTTKYQDGSTIPLVSDNTQWGNNNNKSPMMCWFNNDKNTYATNKIGALYNFYVINPATNGNKKVCPTGWHVPTNDEWDVLIGFIDPNFSINPGAGQPQSTVAGGKMKSTGNTTQGNGLWNSPNTGATNFSGFSGLPGGSRGASGNFAWLGINGYWWSSTNNGGGAWLRIIQSDNTNVVKDSYNSEEGLSVRCILD